LIAVKVQFFKVWWDELNPRDAVKGQVEYFQACEFGQSWIKTGHAFSLNVQ